MSKRFALFIIAVWYPAMIIGGLALVDRYDAELKQMSAAGLAFVFYVWVILFFAPGIWDAFFRKPK